MNSSKSARLDWCSYEAAKYACEKWHYSGTVPAGKTVKIGVWEAGEFIGCVIYSMGANRNMPKEWGMKATEVCELSRIALSPHKTPVSRIVSISLKLFRKRNPETRIIISYADCDESHIGSIYAASNWVYIGRVEQGGGTPKFCINGKVTHLRSVHAKYGKGSQRISWVRANLDPSAEPVYTLGKHKYVWPFDEEARRMALVKQKPYPKRAGSIDSDAPVQPGEGGASPTPALHIKTKE